MGISSKLSTAEILTLKSIPGVGNKSVKIVGDAGLSYDELLYSNAEDLQNRLSKIPTLSALLSGLQEFSPDTPNRFENKLELLNDASISAINYWESGYPSLLKLISDPPPVLFYRGNSELFNSSLNVAVVGTRGCSPQGARVASSTAKEFAKRGFAIVSGLAKGIDTEAHKGALEVAGSTIAVLVDLVQIYPAENQELSRQILENGGLLVSENIPSANQGRNAFVLRDRIQSGLSLGVFVIETGVKGGTMHTVKYAGQQKRLLYCPDYSLVPGYEFHESQYGGIIELVKTLHAQPYSRKNYEQIHAQLEQKKQKFSSDISQITLFG